MDERPIPGTAPLDRGNLAAALLWAADWCNEALLDALEERGWPRFTRSQSLEDRIGAADAARLRTALTAPWGDPPRL